jgi:hypothetical protein
MSKYPTAKVFRKCQKKNLRFKCSVRILLLLNTDSKDTDHSFIKALVCHISSHDVCKNFCNYPKSLIFSAKLEIFGWVLGGDKLECCVDNFSKQIRSF